MKTKTKRTKRGKIKNLNINEFNDLFPKNEWLNFESAKGAGKLKFIKDLFESDTAQDIGRGVLAVLAVSGVIVIAATMPNVFLLFKGARKNYYKKISRETYNNCVNNLKRYGYVDFEYAKDGTVKLFITEKGSSKAKEIQFSNLKIEKPSRWDNKWRIVIFDIPEKHKSARDALRDKLNNLGFRKIQDSVFICPYECFKEVDAVSRIYSVSGFVRYFVVDDFYYNKELKEYYGLN